MYTPGPALKRVFSPMAIAAYITWLAVFVLLVETPLDRIGDARIPAIACMVGFLAAFVLKEVIAENGGPVAWALLAVEGLLALATCALWSDTLSPILFVLFMADCAMCLGTPALIIGIGVVMNAALYWIAAELWELRGAWRLLLAYSGFQLFATLTAWYARRAEEASKALREANAHLLATRSLLEESARDTERLRLARELHDVAGHKLTALKLNLTALQREAVANPQVETSAQLATELLADIRGVVAQMRLHDGVDVRAALAQIVAPFPAPPRIHLDIDDTARVDNVAQAEALLRVVQEAITNVIRHANAKNAWVTMRREGGALRLSVHDDGHADVPPREGFGIAGMRERLAPLAGSLKIGRGAQGGLALDVELPLST